MNFDKEFFKKNFIWIAIAAIVAVGVVSQYV
jgi:predicted negative regulator of RcsB-dependent stress response